VVADDGGAVVGYFVETAKPSLGSERPGGGGRARRALARAREQGCPALVADWRSANALSSRTWTGLGFTETFHRLHRSVGY
jgi:hypothetical protein